MSQHHNAEWLRRKYEVELLSLREIAVEAGVNSAETIRYWMDKHGISRRDQNEMAQLRSENRRPGNCKGIVPETGHRYPISGTHECDDPLCPASRDD